MSTFPDIFRKPKPLSQEDQRLVREYTKLARPLDQLPYTPAFDEMVQRLRKQGDRRDQGQIWHRLLTLRKQARLPRFGHTSADPVSSHSLELEMLREIVEGVFGGTMGPRDRLPYTPEFDRIVEQFEDRVKLKVGPSVVWRLLLRAAK